MIKRALITGATSGIGYCLAHQLSQTHDLLLTGRREISEISNQLPKSARYIVADQADPDAAVSAIYSELQELGWDHLDLAVLNAGIGFVADPAAETAETRRLVLDTNATAPMKIAHMLFPALSAANGRLVLISSVAHGGAANFASYAASKAALNGFGRALAEEWRDRVSVHVIHPGPTASGMHAKAGYSAGKAERLFIPTKAMAAMIANIASGRSSISTASYVRYLFGGYWAGRR